MTSISGSRNAAITGGSNALRIAITAAATNAPPQLSTWAPGTIHAATSRAIVERTHETTTRSEPDVWALGRPHRLLAVVRRRHRDMLSHAPASRRRRRGRWAAGAASGAGTGLSRADTMYETTIATITSGVS